MDASNLFNTYVIGFALNLIAGIAGFFLIRKLFEWLPSEAELHEKFRSVRNKNNARDKLTALTPLIFISFYWLFLANMLLILLYLLIEVLNWPDILIDITSRDYLDSPQLHEYLRGIWPGLTIGRSVLYIGSCIFIAKCFGKGIKVAKQCWDVYKAIDAT
jgi:hypothetical protein